VVSFHHTRALSLIGLSFAENHFQRRSRFNQTMTDAKAYCAARIAACGPKPSAKVASANPSSAMIVKRVTTT
jgi:hypothetical protein